MAKIFLGAALLAAGASWEVKVPGVRMDDLAVRMDDLALRMDDLAVRTHELTWRCPDLVERLDHQGWSLHRLVPGSLVRLASMVLQVVSVAVRASCEPLRVVRTPLAVIAEGRPGGAQGSSGACAQGSCPGAAGLRQ